VAKAAFKRNKTLFISKLDLNLRKKLVKCCIWSISLYGAETWTLRKVYQNYLERFGMWLSQSVTNEGVLHRFKEERNILHTIKRGKANWIGHILCRNCLLKHMVEGKRE
jgi:hypothetical protein